MNIKSQHELEKKTKKKPVPVKLVVMSVKCQLVYANRVFLIITVVFLTSNLKESPDVVAIAHDV